MRLYRFATATGVIALAIISSVPSAYAAERFSDVVCPQATQKVNEYNDMGTQQKINLVELRDHTHAVIERYDDCARQKLSDGYIEPKMHYAQTRAASFLVVAARIEATIHDYDSAQTDLNRAKSLASEVADWRPFDTRSRARPSLYEESAREILASIPEAQALIPKLEIQPPTTAPAPQSTGRP